jgi:hypothetical protein
LILITLPPPAHFDIPAWSEGVSLCENQAELLAKIEELAIHMIRPKSALRNWSKRTANCAVTPNS